jgi:hypothetical protein
MAENIDLNIKIGANVTDLQSQLQKAENLLRQFESALKKATNVGEINYLNNQIKLLNTTISSLGQQMNKVGRPAADATNALGNLSRVAQDAPYGFIGIANNLNPLLESFQRLSKESGGAGGALKSMLAGLTGPAGIGIALGVVSSLVVAFGDDISNFITKTLNGTNAVKEHSDAIKAGEEAYMKAYTEMYKLGNAFDDFNNGLISKKELLKQYNNTLGDTYGKTNDVTEAEKIWESNSENFIKAAILRAAALSQIDKAAKKAAEAFEAQAKPKEAFTSPFAFVGAGAGGASPINLQAQTDKDRLANQKKVIDGLKTEENFHLQVAKSIEKELELLEKKSVYSKFIGKEIEKEAKAQKDNTLSLKEAQDLIRQINKTNTLLTPLEKPVEDTYFEEEKKKFDDFLKFITGHNQKKADLLKENLDKEKKSLEELNKQYEQFAMTISQNVTSALFGMYDAMQQGASAGEALGQMFSRLLRQMAEMVVQAAIFAAVLSLISGGAANGGVSFLGAFNKILGIPKMAAGGIATGPTLAMIGEGNESEAVLPLSKLGNIMQSSFNAGAMNGNSMGNNGQFVLRGQDLVLAMQRSNSSLNIIRG